VFFCERKRKRKRCHNTQKVKREEALIVSLEQKREQEKINILFFFEREGFINIQDSYIKDATLLNTHSHNTVHIDRAY
jgi:hypothetical protein